MLSEGSRDHHLRETMYSVNILFSVGSVMDIGYSWEVLVDQERKVVEEKLM